MSDVQRRDFLKRAATLGAAAGATMAGSEQAAGGDPSFMNNVPDPSLTTDELPTFKFALEKSAGKTIGASYGKEATVAQLPISKGIAGVSMKLEPGASASCTGMPRPPNGRSCSRGACAPPSPIRADMPRPTTSSRATFGISRAATATCSSAWGRSPAVSS